jgi:hypothetical protein
MKSNGYRFDPFAVSGPLSLHDVSIATNRKRSAEAILCDRFLVPQAPTSFRYSVLACSQSLGVCRPRSIWTNLQRCASSPAVERNAKPRRFVQPLRVGYPPKSHRSLQHPQIGARSDTPTCVTSVKSRRGLDAKMVLSMWWRNCKGLLHRLQLGETGLNSPQRSKSCFRKRGNRHLCSNGGC